jgi:hypothetical protein
MYCLIVCHSRNVLATYRMEAATTSRYTDIGATETTAAASNILVPGHGNTTPKHNIRVEAADINVERI